MHEPEYQQTPDVSTEPQRRALDEMSQQLVERLNEMVREQNERAERFAATQHSLSALPGQQPEVPEFPALTLPQAAPPPHPHQPVPVRKKKTPTLPPRPTHPRQEPEPVYTPPTATGSLPNPPRQFPLPSTPKKTAESGCGTVPTIVGIVILLIIMRACS